ncbi:hypothetical protein L7F22_036146 [Adiantum nelumboides]|nr:hypothetical protein [Adiantum nelumboides]
MFQQLQQAARDSLVEGLPTVRSPTGVCEPCQLGKQHRVAFPKQASTRASAPLALVHTDLCGPMSTSSLSGLCYMLVLVDDFSRYTWVSFLKLKSEAFASIRDWKAMVEKEKDLKVKSIRSDRGGEFLSENFARWCKSEGIQRQPTTPYTTSQNGVVERKNRTIMEMARAMLAHASLPRSYWAEACNTAVYIQNRSPTHALQDMTPFQAYSGRKPTVSHFRVFGCSAFVHIPKEKRQKLDFKSRKLLFLGYSAESDAYRLYDPDTRTTTVSRDVVFDESFITSAKGAAAQPIPILPPPSLPDPPASPVITPSTSHPVPPIQPPDVSPDHALSDSDSDLDVADATPEVDLAPLRREKRIPGWLYSMFEVAFAEGNFSEHSKLRHVGMHLKETASSWWLTTILEGRKPKSWEDFKKAFYGQFLPPDFEKEVKKEWDRLSQDENESVSAYVDKYWEILLKVTPFKKNSDEEKMRKFEAETQWERVVEFAYNNTIHSSTGRAPFEIIESAMKVTPFLSTKDKIFEAGEYSRDLDTAFAKVRETLQKSQEQQKKAVDRHRRNLKLKEDDWVLLRFEKARLRKKKGKERLFPKLSMRYYGPFQITERINDVSFRLRLPDTWKIYNAFHVSLLKDF